MFSQVFSNHKKDYSGSGNQGKDEPEIIVHTDKIGTAQENKTAADQSSTTSGADNDSSSAEDHFNAPDEKELRRLMWKMDRRIIPFVALLYLCSFLDRVNIGNL